MVDPDPRQTAKGNFQRASPVDAQRIGVRFAPTAPLGDQFVNVLVVPAQQSSLCQRDKVLVPVQFPGDFVVTHHSKIKKSNLEPWIERRAFAVHRIKMPVDLISKAEVVVAEQSKTMRADRVRLAQNLRCCVGQIVPHQVGASLSFAGRKEELARPPCLGLERQHRERYCPVSHAQAVHQQVAPLVEFLPRAHLHLVPAHSGYARQLVLPSGSHG